MMDDDNEPGAEEHPKGGYTPGMFASVKSSDDFARILGVPKKSIGLIVPTTHECKSKGCQFNAIDRNGGHCPAHERTWYPLKGMRGSKLHGVEFLRPMSSGVPKECQCNKRTCLDAGYFPGQDAIYIKKKMIQTCKDAPGLLSAETIAKLDSGEKTTLYLYPWHFFGWDVYNEDGKWKLDIDKNNPRKYYDKERNEPYDYPTPRNIPQEFLDQNYFSHSYIRPQDRWAHTNKVSKMPNWMLNMLAIDSPYAEETTTEKSNADLLREVEMWKARALFQMEEKKTIQQQHSEQTSGMKRKFSDMEGTSKHQEEEISQLLREKLELECQLSREKLQQCHKDNKARPLRYSDLKEGGILSKHVSAFTLFDTVGQNDAFLDLINYADGSEGAHPEGDGMCENLRQYSTKVKREERSGEVAPPSMDPDSDEYKKHISRKKAARAGGLTWKDDYLAYCLYIRCGLTMIAAACLVGIEVGRMSDIFHEWTQVLDDALCEMFPRPTRKQMLMAYPIRFIEQDGDARTFMLLDATEIFVQGSSNPNVSSSTHSDYKKHCTCKILAGTDPIGCPWGEIVPDGNPGRVSDVMMTEETHILRQAPFGSTVKVDKGFIVEHQAAAEGVVMDRPMKRLRKQIQQSSVDTAQTQKIGNTRIIVENVNGEVKLQLRYLNVLIPCTQFGIISQVVRIGFLLQNFKKAIIQRRDPCDTTPNAKRPCRAEVRWYGAIDTGLRDVRPDVHLWGLRCEIELHAEMTKQEQQKKEKDKKYTPLTPTQISDIILDMELDVKYRKELYMEIFGVTL